MQQRPPTPPRPVHNLDSWRVSQSVTKRHSKQNEEKIGNCEQLGMPKSKKNNELFLCLCSCISCTHDMNDPELSSYESQWVRSLERESSMTTRQPCLFDMDLDLRGMTRKMSMERVLDECHMRVRQTQSVNAGLWLYTMYSIYLNPCIWSCEWVSAKHFEAFCHPTVPLRAAVDSWQCDLIARPGMEPWWQWVCQWQSSECVYGAKNPARNHKTNVDFIRGYATKPIRYTQVYDQSDMFFFQPFNAKWSGVLSRIVHTKYLLDLIAVRFSAFLRFLRFLHRIK